jgi:hypothetical protein
MHRSIGALGTMSSLVSDLMPSATGCRIPSGPTRFGPNAILYARQPLRSNTVVSANRAGNRQMIATTLSTNARHRLPHAGQKAHQPVLEQNEDLVQSFVIG